MTQTPELIRAQAEGKPLKCAMGKHDYQKTNRRNSPVHIIYECAKCGDEVECDVS